MEHANRGAVALAASDADTAILEYTKALIEHPTSPDYFTQRSIAFSRLKPPRHNWALADAEFAVLSGHKRGRRDKIQPAQQRRVVALYNLERYADAKLVLDSMKRWRPENSKPQQMEHSMWAAKITGKLKIHSQEPTTSEYPSTTLPDDLSLKKLLQRQLKKDGTFNYEGEEGEEVDVEIQQAQQDASPVSKQPTSAPASNLQAATPTPLAVPLQKIRHEWYQNNDNVIVTIYAKGVQKDKTDVELEDDSVSVAFPHPSDPSSSFTFALDPLYAFIDPSKSKYQVMSTKVELTLAKVVKGQKWANIEASTPLRKAEDEPKRDTSATSAVLSSLQQSATAPSYPTSSRHGPKNWDKLAEDLTAKKPKKTSKTPIPNDEKNSADSDPDDADDGYDSDLGGDAVDGFFKKLYAGADPDTRRAMMKSFTESNGTALSTNWTDVGSRKVDEVESKQEN